MAHEEVSRVHSMQRANQAARAQRAEAARSVLADSAKDNLEAWTERAGFNPLAITRRFKTLEERTRRSVRSESTDKTKEEEETQVTEVERIDETADNFHRRNSELHKQALVLLRSKVKEGDTKEEILEKVHDFFPDPTLADEALSFLIETSDGELAQTSTLAKQDHNLNYGREIIAGYNMGGVAQQFAGKGLGDPKLLRDIYREVTGNPKSASELFDEFSSHFDFEKMQPLIQFLLHSLGSDMKAKGPSIASAELQVLFSETRNMQAILGVYRFFRGRMPMIRKGFEMHGFMLASKINFELLAKLFVKFLQERYPNTAKLLNLSTPLGLNNEIPAQIIIYTQMKDGLRHTSPKLFRSEKHRMELQAVFLNTLDDLEEKEGEEEKEKDK